MDHETMSQMGMSSSTVSSIVSTATSAAAGGGGGHGGMSMGGNACKISMLWNWYTIDACFLARSWRIASLGMFAGSCIGVILLVMVLEALRRAAKEYDEYLVRTRLANVRPSLSTQGLTTAIDSDNCSKDPAVTTSRTASTSCDPLVSMKFRPTVFEQFVRALLHMLQFAVAYFIMLMAMYYNGYIIISIFVGAFLGAFVFNWTSLGGATGGNREITFCCG